MTPYDPDARELLQAMRVHLADGRWPRAEDAAEELLAIVAQWLVAQDTNRKASVVGYLVAVWLEDGMPD